MQGAERRQLASQAARQPARRSRVQGPDGHGFQVVFGVCSVFILFAEPSCVFGCAANTGWRMPVAWMIGGFEFGCNYTVV